MKRLYTRACLSFLFGGALLLAVLAQPASDRSTKEIMRQKLDHFQSVLEGISLENYDMVLGHASRLSALSQEAAWRAYDTEEYAHQSLLFRRNLAALSKAAREHNLDGATLAYTKVTFSCVECHKYLRGRKVAFHLHDLNAQN